jgi:hypothetical protein
MVHHSDTLTRLPIAALTCSTGSRMNRILSYYRVSAPPLGALLLPGKHVLEIVARTQPAVQILVVRRRFGKARAIVSHEGREEGVAIRQGCRRRSAATL